VFLCPIKQVDWRHHKAIVVESVGFLWHVRIGVG
jgi:hypothetical protein